MNKQIREEKEYIWISRVGSSTTLLYMLELYNQIINNGCSKPFKLAFIKCYHPLNIKHPYSSKTLWKVMIDQKKAQLGRNINNNI